MTSFLYFLAMLLLFSASIFVHELGHFLAARAFGMVADVFSIGMGPALWKRKIGATTYKIGWIFFGGYVALPQMDPNSFLEGTGDEGRGTGDDHHDPRPSTLVPSSSAPRALPPVSAWKKIIVSVAGAFGNVVFAFALAHMAQLAQLNDQGGWALELQGMYLASALALALIGPGRYAINQR